MLYQGRPHAAVSVRPRAVIGDAGSGRSTMPGGADDTRGSRGLPDAQTIHSGFTVATVRFAPKPRVMVKLAQNYRRKRRRERTMALTLEDANRIIEGAVAKARELNIRVSVAVCDAGGRLVAFQRMNNAIWASVYGSQGKAVASAAFGRASGELSERASQPTPAGIAAAEGGHMIMGQGAVPILRDGVIEGACGVGGGTAQQDEDCARYGVAKL